MIARIIASGAGLMMLAVILGAFGAHALKDRLDEYSRSVYEKAAFYHFIHAIGILLIGLMAQNKVISELSGERIFLLMIIGIGIFSGSLYLLAISGVRWLGAITPIGGSLFIVAWAYLAYAAYLNR